MAYKRRDGTGYPSRRSLWTLHEIRWLEQHYGSAPCRELAARLGRPVSSLRTIAGRLGLTAPASPPWAAEEDALLCALYPAGAPMTMLMTRLPGRTWATIRYRAGKLRLLRPDHWQPEEMHILRTYYPTEGLAVTRRLPGRTRDAVKLKACEAGIGVKGFKKGRPWSNAERAALAAHPDLPYAALLPMLPGRTLKQVESARYRMRQKQRRAAAKGADAGAGARAPADRGQETNKHEV